MLRIEDSVTQELAGINDVVSGEYKRHDIPSDCI
jgi:hypothetical protein